MPTYFRDTTFGVDVVRAMSLPARGRKQVAPRRQGTAGTIVQYTQVRLETFREDMGTKGDGERPREYNFMGECLPALFIAAIAFQDKQDV